MFGFSALTLKFCIWVVIDLFLNVFAAIFVLNISRWVSSWVCVVGSWWTAVSLFDKKRFDHPQKFPKPQTGRGGVIPGIY